MLFTWVVCSQKHVMLVSKQVEGEGDRNGWWALSFRANKGDRNLPSPLPASRHHIFAHFQRQSFVKCRLLCVATQAMDGLLLYKIYQTRCRAVCTNHTAPVACPCVCGHPMLYPKSIRTPNLVSRLNMLLTSLQEVPHITVHPPLLARLRRVAPTPVLAWPLSSSSSSACCSCASRALLRRRLWPAPMAPASSCAIM